MSEAAEGVAAAMAEVRLRRKQLLSAEEAELFELAQAAGSGLDAEVFRVLLDLLRMNVAPLAVFQMLKSMCAGQRLPPGPEGGPPVAPAPFPADTRVCQILQVRRGHIQLLGSSLAAFLVLLGVTTCDIDASPVLGQLLQGGRMVWEK
ncbi:mitotic-spindle organizing protein 2-like isoform X2 [Colius striatus]|uniref:mitotic-spindle organizing protein 2-like isoform X2 n=1 Tax=Colius striatus TaxID=57412 RepID=UPI002B1D9EBE|nr:mitotic-spindle organizing protein 2-like isoform X2 [Colius striatus]